MGGVYYRGYYSGLIPGVFSCASYITPPARAGAASTPPAHPALRQLVDHLGQPRVCCPPGCALANPGAPPLWHVHPLAPSGQGFPEGARAVDRRPFPRPVRGRGPQGAARARPGPGARLRSGPASHRGRTATPQEARRITHGGRCTGRCAPSYLRRIWDRRIPWARHTAGGA